MKKNLRIQWEVVDIEHCDHPEYLGVHLDRSLTYKSHCEQTKAKVGARNKKALSWDERTPPSTDCHLDTMLLGRGICVYLVWSRSGHAKKVDVATLKQLV